MGQEERIFAWGLDAASISREMLREEARMKEKARAAPDPSEFTV